MDGSRAKDPASRTHERDPVQVRHSRMVRLLLAVLLVVVVMIILFNLIVLRGGGISLPGTASLGAMALVIVVALLRLEAGRLGQAVGLVVVAVLTLLAVETVEAGIGGSASFLFAYTVPIAFAGLLLGRAALLATAVVSIAIVGIVHLLERAGVPRVAVDPTAPAPAVQVLIFGLVIALLTLVLERFGVELRQAHRSSLARERELARLVRELERQVEERRQAEAERDSLLERERLAREAAERARAELESLTVDLERRVERRTTDLSSALEELESFAYSVSHDLRAPLRGIDGFSQALLEDYGQQLDQTAMQYLARIRAGARRMGELIDDLLDLSRISQGDLRMAEVDLGALARQAVDELRAKDRQRDVQVHIQSGLIAHGDRKLLRIAIDNLVGNAWKFTAGSDRAAIEVGVLDRPGERVYFVRDNGAGFDMAYAHRLFSPFQRLHSAEKFEGTGIGLATVQRVVRRHGGRIWAEGQVEAGATFYFTL